MLFCTVDNEWNVVFFVRFLKSNDIIYNLTDKTEHEEREIKDCLHLVSTFLFEMECVGYFCLPVLFFFLIHSAIFFHCFF